MNDLGMLISGLFSNLSTGIDISVILVFLYQLLLFIFIINQEKLKVRIRIMSVCIHNNTECLCPLCNPDIIMDLKNENNQMAKQLNKISQLLLGYREGKDSEIIDKIIELKDRSSKYNANEKVEELYGLIDRLSELKETILEED